MRNLKKILALVLALMMTLSLMVTANASSYTDADQVSDKYEEAVEVLSGMGIFQGTDKGVLLPQKILTRDEASVLVYRVISGDVGDKYLSNYAGYAAEQFSDVPASAWYEPYVAYAALNGYIQGDGKGHFNPNSSLTGIQLLTIMLRAVGYDVNGEFSIDWVNTVTKKAVEVGIDVPGVILNAPVSREVTAEIIFQVINDVDTVVYTPALGYYTAKIVPSSGLSTTLGEEVFGLDSRTGIVLGNQATGESSTLISDSSVKYPYSYKSGGAVAFNTETGLDLYGHAVKVWYNKDVKGAKTVYALFDEVVDVEVVAKADLDEDAYTYVSDSYSTFKNPYTNFETTYPIYVLIDNGDVDIAIGIDAQVAQICEVNTTLKDATLTLAGEGSFGTIELASVTSDSTTTLGSVVIAQKITGTGSDDDLPYYDLEAVTKTVTGEVRKYDSDSHKVTLSDGTVLEQSPLYDVVKSGVEQKTPDTNATWVFTMDNNGKYLGAEEYNGNTFVYGTYADYAYSKGSSNITYSLYGVDLSGKIVTVTTNIKSADDYTKLGVTYLGLGTNQTEEGEYTGFAVNPDGTVKSDEDELTAIGVSALDDEVTITSADAKKGYHLNGSNLYLTKTTTFIVVSGYGLDAEVNIYNGISELLGDADSVKISESANAYYTKSPYIYNNVSNIQTYKADVVILSANDIEDVTFTSNSSVYYYIAKGSTGSTTDLKTGAKLYTFYKDGAPVDIWVAADSATPAVGDSKLGIFHVLTKTTDVTKSSDPVYTVTVLYKGNPSGSQPVDYNCAHQAVYNYTGAAGDTASAEIDGTLYTVTGAKVVDLTGGKTVDGTKINAIDSLEALNKAVSQSNYTVRVSIVYDDDSNVSVIYVVSVQK